MSTYKLTKLERTIGLVTFVFLFLALLYAVISM